MVAFILDEWFHSSVFLLLRYPLLCIKNGVGGRHEYLPLLWLHAHCCVSILLIDRYVDLHFFCKKKKNFFFFFAEKNVRSFCSLICFC